MAANLDLFREEEEPAKGLDAFKSKRGTGDVVQEMHPEFSSYDRAVVKNLSSNPQSALNYLLTEYPDLDVHYENDQFIARKKGEKDYKVLDPDTGFFSMDFLSDAGDVAGDLAIGVGEGVATAFGGLAGGIAGAGAGGIGAVPGAIAGGAAAGAGAAGTLETARQGLGSMLGLPNNMDTGQIAVATGLGAASPLLMGTGGTAKHLAKFGMKGGTKAAVAEEALKAQEGLVSKSLKGVGTPLSSVFSGVDSDVLKTFGNRYNEFLDNVDKPRAVTSKAREWFEDLKKTYDDELKTIGGQMNAAREAGPQALEIDTARAAYGAHVDAAKKQFDITGTVDDENIYKSLKNAQEDMFPQNSRFMSSKASRQFHDNLRQRAEYRKGTEAIGSGGRLGANVSIAEKHLRDAAADAEHAFRAKAHEAFGSDYVDASDAYGQVKSQRDELLGKYFAGKGNRYDAAKTQMTLRNLNKADKTYLREALEVIDENKASTLMDDANFVQALGIYKKPGWAPLSGGGTTSTTRTLNMESLGSVGGALMDKAIGGGSKLQTLGRGIGMFSGGPAVQKKAIGTYHALKDPAAKLGRSPWSALNKLAPGFQAAQDLQPVRSTLYGPVKEQLKVNLTEDEKRP